ncbi:protein translocase subunit SecF [Treponema sp.]|uniref:protein translocase subunit SecF n=1 Tax=Treponema sp. TaxID=166 RepID=UPI00298EA7F6|nr:protein translocase subunit SecF [Treponema sp.]
MKKRIEFTKFFIPAAVLSFVFIVVGVISIITRGINFSIDFKPGYIEEVQISSKPAVEDVRVVLSGISGVAVKMVGLGDEQAYQIRVGAEVSGDDVTERITADLEKAYGSVNVLKTDFIGSSLSKTLAFSSVLLLLGTLLCIWIYASIRFRWDFALGAIIALLHDALIMFSFLAFFQVEFSTISIAAVLTIIGYSINDTVVILDRVRENIQVLDVQSFKDVINQSLSDTLSRSVITTVTTLFAVVSLYIFTDGAIHDFAWALIIGLISGCYSSVFISSGFITLIRKNWKPEFGLHAFTKPEPKSAF